LAAARRIGQQLRVLNASSLNEIETAFALLGADMPDGLFVASDPIFFSERGRIIGFASDHALPAIYFDRIFVDLGGLMSYGTDVKEIYRQAGVYTARILKGEKPATADLPVVQPSKFELVINLKTAKAQGFEVPVHIQQLADEVIE
jgi:putative ABC transport system substrate-binding protein